MIVCVLICVGGDGNIRKQEINIGLKLLSSALGKKRKEKEKRNEEIIKK